MNGYISFDPWFGAMNNVRLSYEIAAAISYVTDRTLVIPPKVYCLFLSDPKKKETFWDFWSLFDQGAFKNQFNTIDYEDVSYLQQFNSPQQYFDGICSEVTCLPLGETRNWGAVADLQRPISADELFCDEEFIHFPRNLFGFWYSVVPFPVNKSKEKFKELLKNGLRIRSDFSPLDAKQPYNAIHVRMGDFNKTRPGATKVLRDELHSLVCSLLSSDLPLFIATNAKDRTFFNCLADYEYFFADEHNGESSVPAIARDILTCAHAENFHGSRFSTFTDYINILRKYEGRNDCSKNLLNYKFTGAEPDNWHNLRVEEY